MIHPGIEQGACPVDVEPEPHGLGAGGDLPDLVELGAQATHIGHPGLHLVDAGLVHQLEAVAVEGGRPEELQRLQAQIVVHPAQAGGIVNLPGAGVHVGGGGFRGPVVLHQHGLDQAVAGLAGGLIGLELGLQPLVHNHPHHAAGLVDEVHGVEAEIADRGIHHDGVSHRVVVDAAALIDGVAMHDLARRWQAQIRADRLVRVQVRDVGQHELIEHHRRLVGEARLQVAGESVGNDLAHGFLLSVAPNTCCPMSMRPGRRVAVSG
ncbi:hypothetical protein D3C78_734850 [compost metagenome]